FAKFYVEFFNDLNTASDTSAMAGWTQVLEMVQNPYLYAETARKDRQEILKPYNNMKAFFRENDCSGPMMAQLGANLLNAAKGRGSVQGDRVAMPGVEKAGTTSNNASLLYEYVPFRQGHVEYV